MKLPSPLAQIAQNVGRGAALFGLAALLVVNAASPATANAAKKVTFGSESCPGVVVPAYFYPPTGWAAMINSSASAVSFVMNPNSGPGTTADPNYLAQIQKAKQEGMKVYGYVYTSYGARSQTAVEADVAAYQSLYGVTNIFFDEMSASSAQLSYYQTLVTYVHDNAASASVILNPGTYPAQSYLSLNAIFNVFEGSYASFVRASVPGWASNVSSSKLMSIVYATPSGSLSKALKLAKQRNNGYVYITDNASTSNPYTGLPSYWSTELSDISGAC